MKQTIHSLESSLNNKDNNYNCSLCNDQEWIYDREKNLAIPCKCQEINRLNRRIKFGNLPEYLKDESFENFKTECYQNKPIINYALKQIKVWLNNPKEFMEKGIGLYVYSNTKGSGKTKIVSCIANYLMLQKSVPVKFMTTLQLLQEIKNTWGENNEKESRLIDGLITVNVLIIDDLGVEVEKGSKSWIEDRFYHIINERMLRKLPTIYTSNMAIHELPYQDRIVSRIQGNTIRVTFPEESIRKMIGLSNEQKMLNMIKGEMNK